MHTAVELFSRVDEHGAIIEIVSVLTPLHCGAKIVQFGPPRSNHKVDRTARRRVDTFVQMIVAGEDNVRAPFTKWPLRGGIGENSMNELYLRTTSAPHSPNGHCEEGRIIAERYLR